MKKTLFFLSIALFFASCGEQKKQEQSTLNKTITMTETSVTQISVDSLKRPVTILAGKPQTITIPTKLGSIYTIKIKNGNKKNNLLPPEVNPLPVVVTNIQSTISSSHSSIVNLPSQAPAAKGHFTTYTTDNGLALDAIACSMLDSQGNLWIGTFGGGVSRYDGTNFTNFTTKKGLANNVVRSMIEDKSGNLWFGTFGGGVSKYDGTSFTNFTTDQGLANNIVLSMTEDKSGNLWFGTSGGGVSKYDGTSFTNFTTDQGLVNNGVRSMTEDKSGNLWFGTEGGGVSKYDGTSFTNFTTDQGLANNVVRSMIEDKSGNLWFGTFGGGVSKYDGTSFTNFTTDQGLANNVVRSMTEDKSGNLWFGTFGGGVSRYDGNSFTNFTTDQGLANNVVRSITEDKNGILWFGTFGGGVSRYDGTSFTNFTTDLGLANNLILSMTEDKNGNLWFGTSGGGVSRYNGISFTNFTMNQGLANNVIRSMIEDKNGNLWFGTSNRGVSRYDGTSFTNFTTDQGLANNGVRSMTEDKNGNLWFGTFGGGVSRYDGTSFTNFTTDQGLANNVILSMTEDKSGNLWFGTSGGGVSRYDGTSFTNFTTDQGLANNVVWSITEDKNGNLWFGTSSGLAFLPESSELVTAKKLNQNTSKNNSASQQAAHNQRFITIGTSNGLADDYITQVLQGADGKIYVATNYGIASFDVPVQAAINAYYANLNELKKPKLTLKNLEIYNSATGYPVKDINTGQNCMLQDSKGIIWAGTGSDKTALVRFVPAEIYRNNEPPKVEIQNIKVLGENVCWYNLKSENRRRKTEDGSMASSKNSPSEGRYREVINSEDSLNAVQDSMAMLFAQFTAFGESVPQEILDSQRTKFIGIEFDGITAFYLLPEKLVLPYKFNHISFDFNAIELSRSYLVNYQYMLEGMDNTWSPITTKTDVSYTNLSEGTYTFKLKALYTGPSSETGGEWSKPITYTFKVLPPWYRTWWMYSAYILLLVSNVVLIVWWNGRRLRAKAKELQQEVNKATIEIIEQKKVVEEKHKEITDSINYAERIQRSFLATSEMLDKNLKDYFVFFRPKDVVSGDFYWAGELNNGNFAFTCADSTGHGVPGAIMSILNISSLEKSIEKETEPNAILNETRKIIIERLQKDGSPEGGKDGMDCSLLVINKDRTQLSFAAANNPVFIVRPIVIARKERTKQSHSNEQVASLPSVVYNKDKFEFIEFKPDKMPVGKHENDKESFTLKTTLLQKGDVIYILTDGFSDQFGGDKGKKYMIKNLKSLLIQIAPLKMEEQEQKLANEFDKWKGENEQVDDVCIIGVRI